jgi:hypothetical protein
MPSRLLLCGSGEGACMRKPRTHFELIPLALVRKIARARSKTETSGVEPRSARPKRDTVRTARRQAPGSD